MLGSTVLGLAFALPLCVDVLTSAAFGQSTAGPVSGAPATAAATAATPRTPALTGAEALKTHDQELDAALARQRQSVASQAKLRVEIEALGADRRKFNVQLIDTAAQIRDVEATIEATEARLKPLDAQERVFQKSLDERRGVIVEILAALQRIGREPPPALLVRPEDALLAVRTAIALGAVVPEMRTQADALAGDLADLTKVRHEIVAERDQLAQNLDLLARDQLRMSMLIEERQNKQSQAEQALAAERQQATDLAHEVDGIKDLIAKLEADLDPAARAARNQARSIADDAMQPQLAALGDPGRLAPAVAFAAMRGRLRRSCFTSARPSTARSTVTRSRSASVGFNSSVRSGSANENVSSTVPRRLANASAFRMFMPKLESVPAIVANRNGRSPVTSVRR